MLKVAWNGHYKHILPAGHRFPMEKYELLPEQLLYEGTLATENFFSPRSVTDDEIVKVHDPDYLARLKNLNLTRQEIRATGFPLTYALIERELLISGGTIQAVDYAIEYGISGNIAGGTHHAYRDRGEGFCLLNDIALGALHAIDVHKMEKILVLDLDVHQGNGTAKIFENDDRVFTFSMHGEKNYPLHKEMSDWDIALPDNTGDEDYLNILRPAVNSLLGREKPDLIFFQAGVDVLWTDKLGRLAMTIEGCRKRDLCVFEAAKSASIPVVFNMGGGYSENIRDIVEAHANTFRLGQDIFF